MDKAGSKAATAPATAPDAQPASGPAAAAAAAEDHQPPCRGALLLVVLARLLRGALAALVAGAVARAAWRARRDAWDLAFVVGTAALLALLFLRLRAADRLLAPGSPPAERRRTQAAVWALCTAVSGIFAFRVAAVMPPALAELVWCMTAAVVVAGFYMLVVYEEQQEYQALAGVDCDGKTSNKLRPAEESV